MDLVRPLFAAAAIVAGWPTASHAEALRCNGRVAEVGDSRLSVLHKCGQPVLQDTYCAPVFYGQTLQQVPESLASVVVPCQQVDLWLYDRGPGNLMATVRFRAGVVQAITYGRDPE